LTWLSPQTGGRVVAVVLVVVEVVLVVAVVDVMLVVVVGITQPLVPHASQQLTKVPTHAWPPFGATHRAALRLIPHDTVPLARVRQHVTAPACRTWTCRRTS
jgi:hypothetical protein